MLKKLEKALWVPLFIGVALMVVCVVSYFNVSVLGVSEPQPWTRSAGGWGLALAILAASPLQFLRKDEQQKNSADHGRNLL